MNIFPEYVAQISEILAQSNNGDLAEKLNAHLQKVYSASHLEALESLAIIEAMCGPRALGDLNVSPMNGWEWNALLEKLSKWSKKRAKKIKKDVN